MPCIDNQNVIIVMDRSAGLGNAELYDEMLMIEILTGALLRETKNLTVSVVSYADNIGQTSPLRNMAPTTISGTVTEAQCNRILEQYERNIQGTFLNKPQDTVSGRTMELLVPFIKKGTKNIVITFPGTLSNNDPVSRIRGAITQMKNKVGASNVDFFVAGFYAENGRKEQYLREVIALADGREDKKVVTAGRLELLRSLSDILFNNGVLCGAQSTYIDNNF